MGVFINKCCRVWQFLIRCRIKLFAEHGKNEICQVTINEIKRKKGADAKGQDLYQDHQGDYRLKRGGDPDSNPVSWLFRTPARKMPKDNITEELSRHSADAVNYIEAVLRLRSVGYRCFVECLTDNNNRTVASVSLSSTSMGAILAPMVL